MTPYMVLCTETICREVADGLPQNSVALSYALAMRSASAGMDNPDWAVINKAILARWKRGGLERIKTRAHKIFASGASGVA